MATKPFIIIIIIITLQQTYVRKEIWEHMLMTHTVLGRGSLTAVLNSNPVSALIGCSSFYVIVTQVNTAC